MATVDIQKQKLMLGGMKPTYNKKGNQALYNSSDRSENVDILERASQYWDSLSQWRTTVERCWRYLNGRQWSDLVWDPDTSDYVVEEELIKAQGQIPFVVNMIAPLIENIIGQFFSAKSRSSIKARSKDESSISDMLTNTLWAIQDINRMWLKDAAALEMFLVSAVVIQRIDWGKLPDQVKKDVRFKNCELTSMFWNPVYDQDLDDLTMIGQLHDMTIDAIVAAFAETKDDEARIRRMYGYVDVRSAPETSFSSDNTINKSFLYPLSNGKGRVIEVWEKKIVWKYEYHDPYKAEWDYKPLTPESKMYFDNTNANRLLVAQQYGIPPEQVALIQYEGKPIEEWHYKYITPNYDTLKSGVSPYEHKSHPYKLYLHVLNRGEVRSFVSTVLDIQRGFNRDKILLDFVIGAGTKGTLLIDENSISDDFPFEDIVDNYTKRNGVIKLNLKPGAHLPDQLISKAVPAGLNESLKLGLQLMQQIGGISDALQGRTVGTGTPASLYAQSAQNSTLNIRHRLESFNIFRSERDKRLIDIALQFYEEKRYLPLASDNNFSEDVFDRSKIHEDFEWQTQVGQGSDSQIYRSMMDDKINEFILAGLLPIEVGLKNLSFPNADRLRADLEEYKKTIMGDVSGDQPIPGAAGQLNAMPPNITGQLVNYMRSQGADPSQADPRAMALMQQYAGEQ
jgi:hypothetical protein